MINIYHKSALGERLEIIKDFRAGSWIDVVKPSGDELDALYKMLAADRDLLVDALDPYEVPRLETENGATYIFTRVPEKKGDNMYTIPLLVVVGANYLLTISGEKCSFLDNFRQGEKDFSTNQKTKLFLEIFFSINSVYSHFIHDINRRLRAIEINLGKVRKENIVQFVNFERILNDFLAALLHTNPVLQKINSGRQTALYAEDDDLADDVILGNGQLIELSKSTLKNVINIRNAYSDLISQNLNQVMKMFAALTILLTVPTMIFSFYGMNVQLPFESSPLSVHGILLFTTIILISLLTFFVKKRWF